MTSIRFTVSERVRLRTAIPAACAGTLGTIELVLHSVDDICDVQFDGHAQPRLIRACDLERVDDRPPADRQRTPDTD
jgi:hypothetical protein